MSQFANFIIYVVIAANDKSRLRDGTNTDTQNYQRAQNDNANEQNSNNRRNNNVAINKGLHEEWNHYDACQRRERNQGNYSSMGRGGGWYFGQCELDVTILCGER